MLNIKVHNLRTIQKPKINVAEDAEDYINRCRKARYLLKMMASNQDEFDNFKAIQRRANVAGVRFNMQFPSNSDKEILLTVADRKNPTASELFTAVLNLFKSKKHKEKLQTMTDKECFKFLKNVFKNLFKSDSNDYPIKKVIFNPESSYAEKINNALREFVNERYFGDK